MSHNLKCRIHKGQLEHTTHWIKRNQTDLKIIISKLFRVRENADFQSAVGFSFASDWLRGWQTKVRSKITGTNVISVYFWHSIDICSEIDSALFMLFFSSVAVSNTFKVEKFHSLIIWRRHNPLEINEEEVSRTKWNFTFLFFFVSWDVCSVPFITSSVTSILPRNVFLCLFPQIWF